MANKKRMSDKSSAAAENPEVPTGNPPTEPILDSAVSEPERIALLAYSYWEARGCRVGNSHAPRVSIVGVRPTRSNFRDD